MAKHPSIPPSLISIPRIRTLIASLLVSVGTGTGYAFSAYSPQLGKRLKISHTQLNLIALAEIVGGNGSGAIWGRIADSRGPRIPLAFSFVFLLGGYSGIRYFFDSGLASDAISIPVISFYALLLCNFLTGVGSSGGYTSAVNSTAKTFPDRARASTTGLVISGVGLSAFLFSTISQIFFAGGASQLLLLLSLGSSLPMVLGFFFVRPIPLAEEKPNHESYSETSSSTYEQRNSSHVPLLSHDNIEGNLYINGQDDDDAQIGADIELTSSFSSQHDERSNPSLSHGAAMAFDISLNVHGKKLWCSSDFWLLFVILSILSGTGLMYINNVGSMSQCLYAYNNPNYDDVVGSRWQATQVSAISIMNFSGRLSIGLVSDFAKNKYGMPRSYCLVLVALMLFVSQVAAGIISSIAHLWIVSALLGLAYGSVFSLFPTICLEWFGMPHFSENWGYLSWSTMVASNLFSLMFGRTLDAHDSSRGHDPPDSLHAYSAPQCLLGLKCYLDAIYFTMVVTFLAILLSIWAGYRDRLKTTKLRKTRFARGGDVIWQDEAGK